MTPPSTQASTEKQMAKKAHDDPTHHRIFAALTEAE